MGQSISKNDESHSFQTGGSSPGTLATDATRTATERDSYVSTERFAAMEMFHLPKRIERFEAEDARLAFVAHNEQHGFNKREAPSAFGG